MKIDHQYKLNEKFIPFDFIQHDQNLRQSKGKTRWFGWSSEMRDKE